MGIRRTLIASSGTIFTAALAAALALALSGCAIGPPEGGNGGEQFLDAGIASWSSDDDLVNQILADGKVSRAETIQAIEAQFACYEKHGLAGEYGYNLDVEPWTLPGTYIGFSKDNPERTSMPEPYLSDLDLQTQWLTTPEGRQWAEQQSKLLEDTAAKCAVFNKVESAVTSQSDLDEYARRQYLDKAECIRANAPSYAGRIDASWAASDDGLRRLSEEFRDDLLDWNGSDDGSELSKLYACTQLNGSGEMKTFGNPIPRQ